MAGEFGVVLRKLRRDAHLTMRELANYTGISHSQIAKYELGEYVPGRKRLIKFSMVLKVDINVLEKMARQARKAHVAGKAIEPQKLLESLRKIDKHPDYPGKDLSLNDLQRKLMITDTNYADVIKKIRKKYGLSMAEFAKGLGVSASLICRAESGKRRLSRKVLLNLYRLVNTDLNEKDKDSHNEAPVYDKFTEDIIYDFRIALPIRIPVYESLTNRIAIDSAFIHRKHASIWGTKIVGVIASNDLIYNNTIREGDLLIVSMDKKPTSGDLCIAIDSSREYTDIYNNKKNTNYSVILQIIRTIGTG